MRSQKNNSKGRAGAEAVHILDYNQWDFCSAEAVSSL